MFFDRWRKRATRVEPLDLRRHRPAEFIGKTVTLDDREYVIGLMFREGSQGYAHNLVNALSGVSLHIIQIRPDYMDNPEVAFESSSTKAKQTAQLRAALRSEGKDVEIPFITVHRMNGGSFELHETGFGIFDHAPPGAAEISATNSLMTKSKYSDAVVELEHFAADNPNHSVAISNLASCYAALGDYNKALAMCARAIGIEPNFGFYRGQEITIAINSPRRCAGKPMFEKFQVRYPTRGDFDFYGVHASLAAGQPAKAREVLEKASLRNEDSQELQVAVQAALTAHERFSALENQILPVASVGAPADADLLHVLEELCTAYPNDPYIQANLGLALSRAGQNQRAAGLLMSAAGGFPSEIVPYCWANAGYCLLASGDWRTAFALLTEAMKPLVGAHGEITPSDVPRVAVWIGTGGRVKESSAKAADLIEQAIAACPDQSGVMPAVRDMLRLLRTFEAQLS
jgi:tetratricopeptide (TPR) repeat protein